MKRFEVNDAELIERYSQLTSRIAFVTDVPVASLKGLLKVAPYGMTELIPCGIAECHKKHFTGFLVVRPDGVETNIGHLCAKTHLEEDWKRASTEYRERSRLADDKRKINEFLDSHEIHIREAFTIWYDGGAKWLDEARTAFLNGAPDALHTALFGRAKTGNTLVLQSHAKIESDWTAHLGYAGTESDVVTIPVGNIAGLSALKNCIHVLFYGEVFLRVQEWAKKDLRTMKHADIKACVRHIVRFPDHLKRSRTLVAEGRAFFSPENFALFGPLLDQDAGPRARRQFENCKWDFSKSRWAASPKLGIVSRTNAA